MYYCGTLYRSLFHHEESGAILFVINVFFHAMDLTYVCIAVEAQDFFS